MKYTLSDDQVAKAEPSQHDPTSCNYLIIKERVEEVTHVNTEVSKEGLTKASQEPSSTRDKQAA